MFKPVLNTTIRGLAIACMTTVRGSEPASIPKWSRMLGYLVRPTSGQHATAWS